MPRASESDAGGGNTSGTGSRGDATAPALAKKVREVARPRLVETAVSAVGGDASDAGPVAGRTDVVEVVVLHKVVPGLHAGTIVEEVTDVLVAHPPARDAQDVVKPSLLGRGKKRGRLVELHRRVSGGRRELRQDWDLRNSVD